MEIERMKQQSEQAAEMLKSLAHPARLLLLCGLVTRDHSVGELEALTGLSQSALSQHLARLREEGHVIASREAQRVYYRLANPYVKAILETVHGIYCPQTSDHERTGSDETDQMSDKHQSNHYPTNTTKQLGERQ